MTNSTTSRSLQKTRRWLLLVTCCAASTLCGCLQLQVPNQFLVVSPPLQASELRGLATIDAVAADDARLRVQSFRDQWDGNLDFWCEALEHDLTDRRGYALLARAERSDASGNAGREMTFVVTHSGIAKKYLVCVFLAGGRIRTVELVAPAEAFERHVGAVQEAIATLQ